MLIQRVYNHFKRNINRYLERKKYYESSLEEIESKCSLKNTIWFIGSAHYDNIGDLAISSITKKFLNRNYPNNNIFEIRLCDYFKFEKALSKKIKDDDIIVLQGGGNMGFLYFDAEYNRRRVIKKFKKNKIIIFPSTIDYGNTFRERLELKKAALIYNKHNNLYICAREEKSYNFMNEKFKNNHILFTPDIVLYSDFINFNLRRNGICLCLRNDLEKTDMSDSIIQYFKNSKDCVYTDNVSQIKNVAINKRDEIVINKIKEFSKFSLVITDRLHTMIFCYLSKTPCIFLDNSNKKVSSVYNNWILDKCNYIKEFKKNLDINYQIDNMINFKINCSSKNELKDDFEELRNLIGDLL